MACLTDIFLSQEGATPKRVTRGEAQLPKHQNHGCVTAHIPDRLASQDRAANTCHEMRSLHKHHIGCEAADATYRQNRVISEHEYHPK